MNAFITMFQLFLTLIIMSLWAAYFFMRPDGETLPLVAITVLGVMEILLVQFLKKS